jgi:2-succinyl-6-hydroxy-2,4-cyclohexadiene-1-carboxylate synthase
VLVGASAGLERPDERAERISKDEALAQRIETHGLEPFVDEWMALPLFASQTARLGAAALRGAREQRMASEAHGLANSLRGMGTGAQPALHAALHAMRAPVLFAVGDEDLKFKKIAQDLRSKLQTARIAMIPAAGHAAHLENPEAFLRVAADFLTKATEFS